MIEFKDEVISGEPKYVITHADNTQEKVSIELYNNVVQQGTPINKALFDMVCPSGIIVMWSGAIANIPTGWYLCDGNNGTPNLTDKFIVGAGSTYSVTNTGGSTTANVTISLPNHTHTNGTTRVLTGDGSYATVGSGASTGNPTSASSSTTISILPPYYALAYIMKA